MKDIYEILKETGIEVPTEKKDTFDKALNENYKTISDYEKQKAKLTTANDDLTKANEQLTQLSESLKAFEGTDETIENLKRQVADYEKANKEREEAEKLAKADAILTESIMEVVKDKEFVNDYTKNSIIAEIKKGLDTQKGKGIKELFEELTTDKEGIFKNPQQNINLPKSNKVGSMGSEKDYLAKKYKDNPFYKG